MAKLSQKELKDLFEYFLNEKGLFYDFKDFIEEKGYSLSELDMEDE